MKRNPFNMEKNGSIYDSKHYLESVILCNQYDPTAIEQKRNFSPKARRKAYDIMMGIYEGITTNLDSFSTYVNYIPNPNASRGRWDCHNPDRGKIIKILEVK